MKLLLVLSLAVFASAELEKRGFSDLFNNFLNSLSGMISSGGGDEFSKRGAGGPLVKKFLQGLEEESAEELKKQLEKLAHAIEVVKEKLANRPKQLEKTLGKLEPLYEAIQAIYEKKVGGGEEEVQRDEFSKRSAVDDMFKGLPKEQLQKKLEQLEKAIEKMKQQLADKPDFLKKALESLEPLQEKLQKAIEAASARKRRSSRGRAPPPPPPPALRKSN